MISAIFICSDKGEVIVSHDYRNEISLTKGIACFTHLLKKLQTDTSKSLLPEENHDGVWIYHILRNSLYFVAVSLTKQCSIMSIEILTKLFSVLRHFCGAVAEDTIRANLILVHEILLEFMDFGYVQLCNSEKLKSIIYSEPSIPRCRPPISEVAQWGLFGLEKPAVPGEASNKPFFTSRTPNEMSKEEIFVDVVENLSVFIDSEGTVKRSEISGKVIMKNFITGCIDVKLGLNKDLSIRSNENNSGLGYSASLDYCQFHETVNLELFESNRILQVQPSQGEVDLMTYQVNSGQLTTIPFRLQSSVDGNERSRDLKVNLLLRSTMPFSSKAPQVVAKLRVPRTTSSLMSQLSGPSQTAEFDRQHFEVIWRIKDFMGGIETEANLLLVGAVCPRGSHLMELGPLAVEFELSAFLCSGLQINFMQVDDRRNQQQQMKLQRWVRYVTHSNSYVFLLS